MTRKHKKYKRRKVYDKETHIQTTRVDVLALCFDFQSRVYVSAQVKKKYRDVALGRAQIRNIPRAQSSTVETYRLTRGNSESKRKYFSNINKLSTFLAQIANQYSKRF